MINKKITYISKYLEIPTEKSFGSRGYHLIENLENTQNTIITSNSNHLLKDPKSEKKNGKSNIIILSCIGFKESISLRRILSWIEFEIKLFFQLHFKLPKQDIIICSIPSIFSILNGLIYKLIYKSKLVFEVRDIWPLTLVEVGGFSKFNPLILVLSFIETLGYKFSDLIVGTMPNLQEHVQNKIGFRNNIITVPQGVSALQIERQANSDLKIQIDNKKKNICYAGTIGISNHIEDILKLAKSLEKNCDIHFHFFGKGDKVDLIKNTGLSNVSYWGVIDRNQVISTLSKFDFLIFSTSKDSLFKYGQSLNKLIDYMLANKPVIAMYDGYESMLNESKGGKYFKHDDFEGILKYIYSNPSDIKSKDWIMKNRNFRVLAKNYELALNSLFNGKNEFDHD